MNRKTFLQTASRAVVCSCGATLTMGLVPTEKSLDDVCPGCTPCQEKVDFSKQWIKRFMDLLDTQIDQATRERLMELNGKACYTGAHGEDKGNEKMDIDVFVQAVSQYVGPENCRREGNKVYFNYVQNPRGLKIADGYCLCPMIEDGPKDLSPTYCHCSVGYVREMFGRRLGYTPEVQLLESLRSGGKTCRFEVTIHPS